VERGGWERAFRLVCKETFAWLWCVLFLVFLSLSLTHTHTDLILVLLSSSSALTEAEHAKRKAEIARLANSGAWRPNQGPKTDMVRSIVRMNLK
jgi:hypothetical protein